MSVDALAGVNDQGQPYVLEGRHRAIGVARYGDPVPENLGGVPSAPGYLDYAHSDSPLSGGRPVKDMTIDRVPDVSRDEARRIRKQKYGFT